jgi:hypothetical protein
MEVIWLAVKKVGVPPPKKMLRIGTFAGGLLLSISAQIALTVLWMAGEFADST